MAIYEGVWYNHNVGKLILTLGSTAAGFLTAAIVTWVQLVAVATWPIWRTLLYLIRQRRSSRDVFHSQRQVMLRNSSSAAHAAGQLMKMAWVWRVYHVQAFLRTIAYLVVCIAIFVLWTICGLYAPYIYTRTSSDVLLAQSAYCGSVDIGNAPDNSTVHSKWVADYVGEMVASQIYVQQCYGDANTTAGCNEYPRQSLPFNVSDGICPFGITGELCYSVNSTVMTLDTGFLDSSRDFGINAELSNTVQYRRRTTCSPIHTHGFFNQINTTGTPLESSYPPDEVLVQYLYGPANENNYTYQYQSLQWRYPIAYTLDALEYVAGASSPVIGFVPNVTFFDSTKQAGDVSILFLAGNNVRYLEPTYDTWFDASVVAQLDWVMPGTQAETEYISTYFVVPLACHEQYQFCLGGSESNCTPLLGSIEVDDAITKLPGLNEHHAGTLAPLLFGILDTSLADVVNSLGPSALQASRTLNGREQAALLPMDQWRQEVKSMFSIGLANMQSIALAYVTGPKNTYFNQYVSPADDETQKYACRNQRVGDPKDTSNFDVVGLIVLVAVGAFLMVFGLSLENIVGWLLKHSSESSSTRAKWLTEGLYHLHMTALEARGVRDWHRTTTTMPISTHWAQQGEFELKRYEDEQAVSFLNDRKA